MSNIEIQEKVFEEKLIEYLIGKGYLYQDYAKILSLRTLLAEVILFENLKTAIKSLNPNISSQTLNDTVFKIRQNRQASLEVANKQAHELLINGVKVENPVTKRTETIKIVDFENPHNNEFIVTNQFKMNSNHPEYDHQVPDMVVYLNGLPIVVFELKSPTHDDEEIIPKAFQQIKNYQKYLSSLFVFNVFNVISNKHINKYGTITADFDRYFYWKQLGTSSVKTDTSYDPAQEFINLLFEPKTLLNLLKNYIFFADQEPAMKVIAAYHQYYGVQDTKKSVVKAIKTDPQSQSKKAGIFWHTQGTGKTFSMVMLTKNVINIERKITTLVITDRNNLDEQISGVFTMAKNYLGQKVKQIDSIKELSSELKDRTQNGIYLCTVQKFTQSVGLLTDRNDILVITDEAHRTHRNIEGNEWTLQKDLKEITEKFSYAYYLHQAFPQATFVGFTATPIETDDYATWKIFGDYISKYLMMDAVADGCIVKINYESRQKTLCLDPDEIDFMDQAATKIHWEIIKKSRLPNILIKNFHKRIQKIENIIADNDRITAIVKDFINHYQTRKNVLKGKVMFVAFNRKIALKYYHMIIQQTPELKSHLRVIMTPNPQTDKPEELKIIGNDRYREESAVEFKKPNSDFKIAIVVDMWLTGFDVPCLDTIYIDKPIKKHNLMQTIARVNRVYTDEKNKELVKESGLVVDYIGIWKKLNEALSFYGYDQDNLQGQPAYESDISKIKEILIQQVSDIYNSYLPSLSPFTYHQIEQDKGYAYDVIEEIQQLVIKNGCQQQFVKITKPLSKWLGATLTILASPERIRTQILMLARSQLIKRELGRFDLDKDVQYMQQVIEKTIKYNKTIVYDELATDKISLTEIIAYIKKNNLQKNADLVIQKTILAVRTLIGEVKKTNNIRGEKLSKKLNDLLVQYDANFMSYEEFFEILTSFFAQKALEIDDAAKKLGLIESELAFYEIIASDEYSQSQYDQKMIKKITLEIFHKVKKELDQSWFYNERKKQIVRATMLITLAKNKYPPSACKKLQKQLVAQLEEHINTNRIRIRDDDKIATSNEFNR